MDGLNREKSSLSAALNRLRNDVNKLNGEVGRLNSEKEVLNDKLTNLQNQKGRNLKKLPLF